MIIIDEKSNAQGWELEITCKNKEYLVSVVEAILKYGIIDFEVKNIEFISNSEEFDARYTVFMCCSWFSNLKNISNDLAEIEAKYEKFV